VREFVVSFQAAFSLRIIAPEIKNKIKIMFELFTNNRGNSFINFENYTYRYFRFNKSSGDNVWRYMQNKYCETIENS